MLIEFGFIDVEVSVEEKRLMALKESKGSDDPICHSLKWLDFLITSTTMIFKILDLSDDFLRVNVNKNVSR